MGPAPGDGSIADAVTTAANTNASVTRGSKKSAYPNYFFTPKENVFESKRGSRYEKGQPQAFHLTQPDTNLAKFVFMKHENKKRPLDSHSMINTEKDPVGAFHSIQSFDKRSPKSTAYKTSTNARGFLASQHSVDSDGTINQFLAKD